MLTATRTLSLAELARELEAMGVDPASFDLSQSLSEASAVLSEEWRHCFDESRSPDNIPWLPLKRSRRKPLVKTGRLMRSGQGQAAVLEKSALSLLQGSTVEYAGFQNDGTRTIPARPFGGISDRAAERIEGLIADDVVRQLGYG